MKLHIFKLAFSLLVLAICCRAGFDFGPAADAGENLKVAITEAQSNLGNRQIAKFVAESPWQGDPVLHNNIVTQLHRPDQKFSHLGTVDGYELYGMDWKLELAGHAHPQHRILLFALQRHRKHFAPLGFVKYEFVGVPHFPDAFWSHSEHTPLENRLFNPNRIFDYPSVKRTAEMRRGGGFPPDFFAPTRQPGP